MQKKTKAHETTLYKRINRNNLKEQLNSINLFSNDQLYQVSDNRLQSSLKNKK